MMTSMLLIITRSMKITRKTKDKIYDDEYARSIIMMNSMKITRKIEAKIYDDEYALQGTTQWYSAFIIAHCQESGVSANPFSSSSSSSFIIIIIIIIAVIIIIIIILFFIRSSQ